MGNITTQCLVLVVNIVAIISNSWGVVFLTSFAKNITGLSNNKNAQKASEAWIFMMASLANLTWSKFLTSSYNSWVLLHTGTLWCPLTDTFLVERGPVGRCPVRGRPQSSAEPGDKAQEKKTVNWTLKLLLVMKTGISVTVTRHNNLLHHTTSKWPSAHLSQDLTKRCFR